MFLILTIVNALSITFIAKASPAITGVDLAPAKVGEFILYLPVGTLVWNYISVLFGTTLFAICYGVVHTLVILGTVALFFNISLAQAHILSALVILALGSCSFVGILAAVLPLLFPERGAQMTNVVNALILLVSGVYFPISVLPSWMQALSKISAAFYVLEGARAALLQNADVFSLTTTALLPLAVNGTVSLPFGLWVFYRAERYAKRTGKLKRNG